MNAGQTASDKQAFAQRFNEALDTAGFPAKGHGRQAAVAEFFKRSGRAVQRWLVGDGMPDASEWQTMADRLNVRVEWLFFGLGPRTEAAVVAETAPTDDLLTEIVNAVDMALADVPPDLAGQLRGRLVSALFKRLQHHK